MQFQKDAQNAGLTRRNAPHNLSFYFYTPFSGSNGQTCPTIATGRVPQSKQIRSTLEDFQRWR
jgi:hypothetical protein